MSILILAEDIDASADTVLGALLERGAVVHRVNTAWFPAQLSISAELRGERWTGRIQTTSRVIDIEEITAVWYRTPRAYQFPADLSPAERGHANLEAKYGLGGMLSSLPVRWMNHPSRLADAAYKPVQLVFASQCGLRVPATVITNEADTVREFARDGKTVSKVFGSNTLLEEGVRKISNRPSRRRRRGRAPAHGQNGPGLRRDRLRGRPGWGVDVPGDQRGWPVRIHRG